MANCTFPAGLCFMARDSVVSYICERSEQSYLLSPDFGSSTYGIRSHRIHVGG